MTLLNKSLTTALLAGSMLTLTGCFGSNSDNKGDTGSGDADTDADSDTDTDTDSGGDTNNNEETGIAYLYHLGAGTVTEGAWVGGSFGAGWYGVGVADWVCTTMGTWGATENPAAEGCPDCEWAFDLSVTGSVEDGGPECDDLRAAGLTDGFFDNEEAYWQTTWGFTNTFDWYGDGSLIIEDTILLEYKGNWFQWAWNAAAYDVALISGDATDFSFYRGWTDTAGTQFYYYYYL